MAVAPPNFNKIYYIEDFVDDLETFMKANLNTYIAKMNVDKTDIVLLEVDDTEYHYQSLDEQTINHDPFVFYGERGPESTSVSSEVSKKYLIDVAIVIALGMNKSFEIGTKLVRYRKVLEELFKLNYDQIHKRIRLDVSSLAPFPLAMINSTEQYAGIGVTLEVNLA